MPLRLRIARFLIVLTFVWPFVNVAYFYPDATVEIDFFLVFLAVGLAPESLLGDKWSLLLLIPTLIVSAAMGSMGAALRVVAGVVPLLFVIGLHQLLAARGQELIPRPVAYRALQAFVGFASIQFTNFNLLPIIPGWLSEALTILVPRYMTRPYDEFGIRGVQGWASEPSAAAMTCFAFSIVAVLQEPQRRWRILLLFVALTALNKSIYAFVLLAVLGLALVLRTKNKILAALTFAPSAMAFVSFIVRSARVTELWNDVLIFGLGESSSREFQRIAQILYPLAAFPKVYKPALLYGSAKIEPLGLLPLLVGYGSVLGCILYCRIVFGRVRSAAGAASVTLALASVLMISLVMSPDFVPLGVALAYSTRPKANNVRTHHWPGGIWFARLTRLVLEAAGARRRELLAT